MFFFVGQSRAQQSTAPAPAPSVRPLQPQNGSEGKEMNTHIYILFI